MEQLMMYRKEQPIPEYPLPKGFTLRTYREGDARGWIEVCSDGLGTGSMTEEDFRKQMLEVEGILPQGIFFVVDEQDRIVGTATGGLKAEPDAGYLHMVSVHPDYRGKRLSKPLNTEVLRYLSRQGRKYLTLYTDDFRLAAIKVYLAIGFRPILYMDDMAPRWEKVLGQLGIKQADTFIAEGKPGPLLTGSRPECT